MLRGIHKASSTWLGRALMAVVMGGLVVSFAIWGIGDIFRGFGQSSAVKVGKTEISAEQFRQYYNERIQQLGRQVGRPITPDQARGMGIDRQVLNQLVAESTLDEQAKALRLGIPSTEIAGRITSDPSFRGLSGQFDRARFEQLIRQAGYTEIRFVDEQRRVILRRQIGQTIGGELPVPAIAMAALNQYQNEKRTIEYLALGPAQAGDIAAPTPEVLGKYFEERKVLFRAPEYRKISLMSLASADVAKPDAVSDADAKNYYEQRKNTFGTPEMRELRQIIFPNADEAAAAHERIVKGLKFAELAKERGLKDTDTDVGTVTKSDILDPLVADAAFALKAGEISAPVKGQFGTVLLEVGKIEPGTQKSYEEVAPQIKRDIAESLAKRDISNLRDKFEDERAAGSTLVEAAKKLGLKSRTIEAMDRSGRSPDGKSIDDLPKTPDVIAAVFSSDVGVDAEPLQLPNGGYLWYDVNGITQSRERMLDEVKAQVEARWRDDEIGRRLQAKTDAMVAKLKAGGTLAQAAGEAGLKVETAADLQRRKPAGFIPAKLVDAVFTSPKGALGSSAGDAETQRFVYRVTEVTDPKLDAASPEAKQLSTSLKNSYAEDIVGEYLARLENEFGVSLNQSALNQVIGGATNN